MNVLETLCWAIVELQSPRPDMHNVKAALEKALDSAAKLDISHATAKNNVIRLAQVCGADDEITGGLRWKI